MLVYVTYAPLNLLCLIMGILEIKLIVLPVINRWKLLNQQIKILPYISKTALPLSTAILTSGNVSSYSMLMLQPQLQYGSCLLKKGYMRI